MSSGINYMHSHSALERELRFPKKYVLVDTRYGDLFSEDLRTPFTYNGHDYYKVHIYLFWKKGGVFKDLFY